MVKESFLQQLNERFGDALAKHGVTARLAFEQAGFDVVAMRIPAEIASKHHADINAAEDEADWEGVTEQMDESRDRRPKKGADRWVMLAVEAKHVLKSVRDEETLEAVRRKMGGGGKEAAMDEATGLIPIPPPPKNASTEVYLPLRYEPYDQIEGGGKGTEFRAYTPHWVKALLSHPIKTVKFQRGYGAGARQMVWKVRNIELYDIESRKSANPRAVPEGFRPTHIAVDLGGRVS